MTDLHSQSTTYEVEEGPEITDKEIRTISSTARRIVELENQRDKLLEELSRVDENLYRLQCVLLPQTLVETGVTHFSLAKGWNLTLEEHMTATIPKGTKGGEDLRPEAFDRLESQGAGSIIKHMVIITFGRGEEAWAKKFLADCKKRKRPLNAKREDTVHPQTLSAYVRERNSQGLLDEDDRRLYGVHEVRKAVITRPSKDDKL